MMLVIAVVFLFGAAIGSFLNVVTMRYDGEKPFFSVSVWGGRSACDGCGKQLRWFELMPIASFIFQGGKCRRCGTQLSFHYPVVEILSGLIFLLPFLYFMPHYSFPVANPYALWLSFGFGVIALSMLALSAVDMRLMLIPNELSIIIGLIGIAFSFMGSGSFLGNYAEIFPAFSPLASHIFGGVFGFAFLGAITLFSRGRAMGMGDVKLAGAMGFVLGLPDIVFSLTLGFLVGGFFGIALILLNRGMRKKTLKMHIPFGPFLVIGFWVHIFFGHSLVEWYFSLI